MKIILTLVFLFCGFTLCGQGFTEADRQEMRDFRKEMQEFRISTEKRLIALETQMIATNKRIEDVNTSLNIRISENTASINNVWIALVGLAGCMLAFAAAIFGFALWDRKTMLRPIQEENKVLITHLEKLEDDFKTHRQQSLEIFRADAKSNQEVKDLLNKMGIA